MVSGRNCLRSGLIEKTEVKHQDQTSHVASILDQRQRIFSFLLCNLSLSDLRSVLMKIILMRLIKISFGAARANILKFE